MHPVLLNYPDAWTPKFTLTSVLLIPRSIPLTLVLILNARSLLRGVGYTLRTQLISVILLDTQC